MSIVCPNWIFGSWKKKKQPLSSYTLNLYSRKQISYVFQWREVKPWIILQNYFINSFFFFSFSVGQAVLRLHNQQNKLLASAGRCKTIKWKDCVQFDCLVHGLFWRNSAKASHRGQDADTTKFWTNSYCSIVSSLLLYKAKHTCNEKGMIIMLYQTRA